MKAIIELQGQQFTVEKGSRLLVNRMSHELGSDQQTDQVYMLMNNQDVTIGEPLVKGAVVKYKVVDNRRGKKLIVIKFRRRKHSMKRQGHRHDYTMIEVTDICQQS